MSRPEAALAKHVCKWTNYALTKASRSTRWRKANPDKARSQVKTETERYRETRAAYYQANKRLWQNKRLQAEYGITIEEYDALLAAQGGKCAICGTEQCATGKAFAVDHDHDTGMVRGLLCKDCNIGLGMFKDDTFRLKAALDYLS
jgi:hypothetical protein